MTFKEFGFEERIQRGIDEAGFSTPMPVQIQSFKLLINEHRDVYAQSQTGTGKTAAFFLSIFQLLVTEEEYKDEKALVVVPTRELAVQIEHEGRSLGKYLDLRIGSVFGGVGYAEQERMLANGLDILIGTPGRLLDFSKKGKINFKDFRFLVVDEADRLFDMGFLPDLREILKGMRPHTERYTMLFSATLNARVGNLAWEYMNNPGEVIIEPERVTVETVTQELYHVGKDEKMRLLLGLLKQTNPDNAVIFTNTRHSAWEVAKRLEVNGYAVTSLMGDLPQKKRLKIVDAVKKGHQKFLVATDVAARGLHIEELEMVINYDVPLEAESYVHRIGRTARAGKKGRTITMACEEYVYGLGPIEKLLGHKLPVSWADKSLFAQDRSAGMRFPPRERYREIGGDTRSGGTREKRKGPPRKHRGPGANKRTLDPRASHIQSAVSSVAGGKLEDISPQKRKDTPGSGKHSHRLRREQGQPTASPTPKPSGRKRRGKKPPGTSPKPAPSRPVPENKTISSASNIDERLEYYRRKYGENFRLSHPESQESSSGGQDQKKKGILGRLFGK